MNNLTKICKRAWGRLEVCVNDSDLLPSHQSIKCGRNFRFSLFFRLQSTLFFVGVLVSLHRQNSSLSDHLGFGVARCGHGDLNVEALQQVVAAKWAVDVINAQSGPEDLKIGKES